MQYRCALIATNDPAAMTQCTRAAGDTDLRNSVRAETRCTSNTRGRSSRRGRPALTRPRGRGAQRAGDAAGFKAGDANGHHLQNRSNAEARVLEIGTRVANDGATYSDIDMIAPPGGKPAIYTRRDGTPYADIRRRGPEK